jgi:hypothetical protein
VKIAIPILATVTEHGFYLPVGKSIKKIAACRWLRHLILLLSENRMGKAADASQQDANQ